MKKGIRQAWFFEQSSRKVWEYLTDPQLLEQWLMKTDFQPVVGHKFHFTFQPKPGSEYEGIVDCEVLEVKPFTKLSYSWNGRTKDKSRSFHSIVAWTLIPKDHGTELLLQHNGFGFADDILSHSSGWITCLQRLEENIKFHLK